MKKNTKPSYILKFSVMEGINFAFLKFKKSYNIKTLFVMPHDKC